MTTPKWIKRGKNNTKLNTNLTVHVVKYQERKRNTYLVEFLLCIGRRYIHNRDLSIFFSSTFFIHLVGIRGNQRNIIWKMETNMTSDTQ